MKGSVRRSGRLVRRAVRGGCGADAQPGLLELLGPGSGPAWTSAVAPAATSRPSARAAARSSVGLLADQLRLARTRTDGPLMIADAAVLPFADESLRHGDGCCGSPPTWTTSARSCARRRGYCGLAVVLVVYGVHPVLQRPACRLQLRGRGPADSPEYRNPAGTSSRRGGPTTASGSGRHAPHPARRVPQRLPQHRPDHRTTSSSPGPEVPHALAVRARQTGLVCRRGRTWIFLGGTAVRAGRPDLVRALGQGPWPAGRRPRRRRRGVRGGLPPDLTPRPTTSNAPPPTARPKPARPTTSRGSRRPGRA